MSIVPPAESHLTYQLQYRTCGKTSCKACRAGRLHGPYWYAFWREARRLRSAYIGKVAPPPCRCQRCQCTHKEAESQPACHLDPKRHPEQSCYPEQSCHPERSEGSSPTKEGRVHHPERPTMPSRASRVSS